MIGDVMRSFPYDAPPPAHRRARDIEDAFGAMLRLSVDPHPDGSVILLERVDHDRNVMLDIFGAEMLAATILSARMATPAPIPAEQIDGRFPAQIALVQRAMPLIEIRAPDSRGIEVPVQLWDRLFIELTLACVHARETSRRMSSMH
jgi:hypothetical protein